MEDNDDLYFSFDDDEDVPADSDSVVEGEESQNRTFLIGAIILAAIFVIGIAFVAIMVFFPRGGGEPQVSANELTNQANMTLYAATQTAAFETQQAPPVAQATEEPTSEEVAQQPTLTPTLEPATEEVTVEATTEVTEEVTAETTGEVTEEATTEGQGGGGEIETPTPQVTNTPTEQVSGIIEVTPLGEGGDTTTEATVEGQGGGQVQPSAEATLPDTGFSAGAGIAGAGVLALALVAVLVVVRRIRLKD
jgi:outer membrane biosynthesis protein TonB